MLTVAAAVWTALLLLAFGNLAFQAPWQDVYITAALGVPFLAGGAVAGLGAMTAEIFNECPGRVQARWHTHIAGGVAGVLLVLALASAASMTGAAGDPQPRTWWPLFALAPLTLVVGGGLRNLLMARDAMRLGTALAGPGPMSGRVAASCALCLALAAVAALMPP